MDWKKKKKTALCAHGESWESHPERGDPTYLQGAAVPERDKGGDMKVALGHTPPAGWRPGPK